MQGPGCGPVLITPSPTPARCGPASGPQPTGTAVWGCLCSSSLALASWGEAATRYLPVNKELFLRRTDCDGRIGKGLDQMKLGLGGHVWEAKAETN